MGRDLSVPGVVLHDERPTDRTAIRSLLIAAFGGRGEADLVDRLRADGDLAAALVVERDRRIVGFVALSRLRQPARSLALAPLAVQAGARRQGIGGALVAAALDRASKSGASLVFVLGDPAYYARFGFTVEAGTPFESAYAGPHFMALHFGPTTTAPAPVLYPPAFDNL
jgi:putative acetyltransferase